MDDLISRQAAIEVLAEMQGRCTSKAALIQNSKIWQQIKDLPSADRPIGHWIYKRMRGIKTCKCSECLTSYGCMDTPFCPNCGADMRGGDNEAD